MLDRLLFVLAVLAVTIALLFHIYAKVRIFYAVKEI